MPKPILRSERHQVGESPLHPGAALARAGVRPRKSRGQNFLVQGAIARRIVAALALESGDAVVEIGPGLGILTDLIIAQPISGLTLIELDADLAAALGVRLRDDARIAVINEDFLRVDLDQAMADRAIKVIGNLPFNVAAAMLERLCAHRKKIPRMVLMFQREVADRIRARPGSREYSALSVFNALYWEVVDHFRVAAGNFHPQPKVDAVVLTLVPRGDSLWRDDEEDAILATVRAAFSAPRKTLRNSLAGGLQLDPYIAERTLIDAGIDPSLRPGLLATDDFVRLARSLGARALSPRDA
jgi:16S rRNA (adenine1518-N6/adenine1519-N6)-dimethyltransferase